MVRCALLRERILVSLRSLWQIAAPAIVFFLCAAVGIAQGVPTITSISPSTVKAGGPAFTLTVNGAGYFAGSVVQVNGTGVATTFVSATQLTAAIPAADIATQSTVQITVFNPSLVAAGGTSAPSPLTVAAATLPAPTLTNAAPGFTAQGAGPVQLTLQGTNFRPGATVVISPPLTSVTLSNGHTRATDVVVNTVNLISGTLMTASVSLNPGAAIGLRAIDVLNADGTSTAAGIGTAVGVGTSKPLQVAASTSIAAPVTILNLALIHPRDGTAVALGSELYAEAVLTGVGSGSIIGQWLWDGRVVEQFSASLVAGQSVVVKTRQSLPTWYLGAHTVFLRMQQPTQISSKPVRVIVNPAGWQQEELLTPTYGMTFRSNEPPSLLWAPVPGAMRYQIGFTTKPYLSTIETWYDANDNQWDVPADVWRKMPKGNLYWTVRAIESPNVVRRPLPLRSIVHVGEDVLAPVQGGVHLNAAGHEEIDWTVANPGVFYMVTITRDAEGNQVVRRYLTDKGSLDLHAIESQLVPGAAYFWHVDVYSRWGDFLFSGPQQQWNQPRVAGPTQSRLQSGRQRATLQYASLRAMRRQVYLDLAAEISKEMPAPNSSVTQAQPAVQVQFQAPVNPAEVSLSMDDIDITPLAQLTQTSVAYTPQLPLANGDHDVSLTVGSEASGWKFTVAAPAPPSAAAPTGPAALQPGTDAEAAPTPSAGSALGAVALGPGTKKAPEKKKLGGEIDGQISSTTQWASGSNPPDSNVFSVAERMISNNSGWHPQLNGSGLLNSILNPEVQRTSQGRVNDYIAQIERKGEHWGASLKFGIVSPALYTDAQFVTAATPRQGVEAMATTPGGKLGFYTNTNDEALGGGAGITFHQRLLGGSWQAPLPKWAEFRLMWLGAKDVGPPTIVEYDSSGNPIVVPNPVATASRGDVYGGLLNLHMGKMWQWTSEYAWSYDNANITDPTSTTLFGRAWRSGISGSPRKANLSVAFRDLSANFGNPANPSLTQASNPNLRGVDASASSPTKIGTFAVTYSFLQNNVNPTTTAELDLNSATETWTKAFGPKTSLTVGSNQSTTETGTIPAALQALPPTQNGSADQRDVSGNVTLSRQVGMVSLSAGGTRDWLRNNIQPTAGAITSSLQFGANVATKGFFQINTQANFNWVAADPAAIGTTRNISVNVQPAFVWKQPNVQVSPVISVVQGRTLLASGVFTSNTLTGQYGGRFQWTLPKWLKTSTLAVQGSYNQNRDDVAHTDLPTTQLIGIWTFNLSHKKTF